MIKVGIRVRPANEKEIAKGSKNVIKIDEANNQITLRDEKNRTHNFECDFIITDQLASTPGDTEVSPHADTAESQQQYVYECAGKPLLDKAFDGYNVSIFAYGQTGSGKTYSMIGTGECPGLIPRFFDDLFEKKEKRETQIKTQIEISYYEIYNEKIFDLLRASTDPVTATKGVPKSNLQIREDKQKGPYIVGLQSLPIDSAKDAKMWLDIGNKRRATAYTNMNDKSSRSHSVFQIKLTQMLEQKDFNESKGQSDKTLLQLFSSTINLVDLAGSERNSTSFGAGAASGAFSTTPKKVASYNPGNTSRFKESTCINKSLLTLGKIIFLLSERQSSTSSSVISNNNHLPYRDSVLTFLLKVSD